MPVLQYRCPNCGKKFDELVKNYADPVTCPVCKHTAERVWSGEVFSSTGKKCGGKCSGNCRTCGGCH